MKLHVFSTNCDCASGYITRIRQPKWVYGPRCPYCNTVLGCMQYSYYGRHSGDTEEEIIKKAKIAFVDKMNERFQDNNRED